MESFVKLLRNILAWEWYQDSVPFRLYIHLLLRANYTTKKWQGTLVQRGQLITSTDHLAHDLNLSIQQIRTGIKKLKSSGYITVKTTNKFSMITVVDYDKTQGSQLTINTPNNNQKTNEQQSTHKQITTTKERKKIKENNKDIIDRLKKDFKNDVFKHSQYSNKILNEFIVYWTEIDSKTDKIKFEKQSAFEVSVRLKRWVENENKYTTQTRKKVSSNR